MSTTDTDLPRQPSTEPVQSSVSGATGSGDIPAAQEANDPPAAVAADAAAVADPAAIDPAATALMAEDAVALDAELETQRIERLAKLRGVEPVLARQDLPEVAIIQDEGLREWLRYDTCRELCVMDDGSVISAEPDAPEVEAACSLLNLRNYKPVVRPALAEVVQAVRRALEGDGAQIGDELITVEDQTSTDVSRLFETILDTAVAREASDIHFEMRESKCDVRFRINGRLTLYDQISARETMALGNYMFNAEAKRGALQFITYMPLNGSLDAMVRGQKVAIRLSTAPDIRGVDIFLRIWRPDNESLRLGELGYSPVHLELLREAVGRPYGVIVVSGPTGSGKSTSLTAMLETVDPALKVVSLEEPVERMLPNVTHVAISAIAEHGGWENLRAGLNRWDSNINMLGEIKDQATADAIKDLVTSGKLTATTLHASNVLSIPLRMEDLGVGHTMLYDPNFLVLLVNQRLLPELCLSCRRPLVEESGLDNIALDRYRVFFGERLSQVYVTGPGCDLCNGTGVSGRLLAAEMVMVDETSREFIRKRDQIGWREYLIGQGWEPIIEHVRHLCLEGLVDPRDAERLAGSLGVDSHISFDYRQLKNLLMQGVEQ